MPTTNRSLNSVGEFIRQYEAIADLMLTGAAFIGATVFLYGLYGFYKRAENPNRYTLGQSFRSLIAGSMLLIPASIYSIFKVSIFTNQSTQSGARNALAIDSHLSQAAQDVNSSIMGGYIPAQMWTMIIGFMFLVGLYSFLKGIFLIRSIGIQDDSGQLVSPKKVFNHLFFGMICMNITVVGPLIGSIFFN